jgi:hypothetical protein
MVVRPLIRLARPCCTSRSLSASSALVASSSSSSGALRRIARAIAMQLALAAGESHAALAEIGVVAAGQTADELIGGGRLCRAPHLVG